MKANDPNALLARDARSSKSGAKLWRVAVTQGRSEARRQGTLPPGKAGGGDTEKEREEMKYKVTATFDAINEAMALVNALVGVVDEVEMIDEEDEDDDD
jgi:hypothetical protein